MGSPFPHILLSPWNETWGQKHAWWSGAEDGPKKNPQTDLLLFRNHAIPLSKWTIHSSWRSWPKPLKLPFKTWDRFSQIKVNCPNIYFKNLPMLNNKAKPTNILNQQNHPSTALDVLLYDLYYFFSQTGDYLPIKPFQPTFFFGSLELKTHRRTSSSGVVQCFCSIFIFFPWCSKHMRVQNCIFYAINDTHKPSKEWKACSWGSRPNRQRSHPKDQCSSLWRGKEDAWQWDKDGEVVSSPAKLPQVWSPTLSSFPSSPPRGQQPLNQTRNDHFINNKPQKPSLLRCKGGSPRRLGRGTPLGTPLWNLCLSPLPLLYSRNYKLLHFSRSPYKYKSWSYSNP